MQFLIIFRIARHFYLWLNVPLRLFTFTNSKQNSHKIIFPLLLFTAWMHMFLMNQDLNFFPEWRTLEIFINNFCMKSVPYNQKNSTYRSVVSIIIRKCFVNCFWYLPLNHSFFIYDKFVRLTTQLIIPISDILQFMCPLIFKATLDEEYTVPS